MTNDTVHCTIFEIKGVLWSKLEFEKKKEFAQIIKTPKFSESGGDNIICGKFGFVKCQEIILDESVYLYGSFTQEIKQREHSYKEEPTGVKELKYDHEPWIDFFFVIFLDLGICLLQNKKLVRENVTPRIIQEHFIIALNEIFKKWELPFTNIEKVERKIDKNILLTYFKKYKTLRVEVTSLLNRKVPENFRFYNPNFDKDKILHDAFDEDFGVTDEVSLKAGERKDLRNSKITRALIESGEVRQMRQLSETGRKMNRTNKIGPTIDIRINLNEFPHNFDQEDFIDNVIDDIQRKLTGEGIDDKYLTLKDSQDPNQKNLTEYTQ